MHNAMTGLGTFTLCANTFITKVFDRVGRLSGSTLKSYETPMATSDHPETIDSGLLNNDEHSIQ